MSHHKMALRIFVICIYCVLVLIVIANIRIWIPEISHRSDSSDTSDRGLLVQTEVNTETYTLLQGLIEQEVQKRIKSKKQAADKSSPNSRPIRLLCWILADPRLLKTKVIHQKQTWGRRCDKLLVMSSIQDDDFPAIGLNVTEGRNHIAMKSRAAWIHIYKHYWRHYDFFIKTDPDTYLVVENLREYLQGQEPEAAEYHGHRFTPRNWTFTYMAGGPGLILTRESVRRLVTQAFVNNGTCITDGQGEDWKICKCLSIVGCRAVDTRDSQGKERFFVFKMETNIHGDYPEWYRRRDDSGSLQGSECCSDYPISFHYVNPKGMYVLEYYFYHTKVHGRGSTLEAWPEVLKVITPNVTKTEKVKKKISADLEASKGV